MHASRRPTNDRNGKDIQRQRQRQRRYFPCLLASLSALASSSITVVTKMGDVKFILLTSTLQGRTSRRDVELLQVDVRSHAAKVSHASRKHKLSRQIYGRSRHDQKSPWVPRHAEGPAQPGEIQSAILPHPRSILGQGKVDPFRSKHFTDLPPAMVEGLEYVYEVLWPNTAPALKGRALRDAITTWRRDGRESPLIYYSQVANVATLCHGVATDPSIQKTLLKVRLQRE
jgi:hypothetical protein